jgi:hypothetical protein
LAQRYTVEQEPFEAKIAMADAPTAYLIEATSR